MVIRGLFQKKSSPAIQPAREIGWAQLKWIRTLQRAGVVVLVLTIGTVWAEKPFDGFLKKGAGKVFPIGFYELPSDGAELQKLADAGVNLVHCRNRADLDRVHAAGLMGWISLPLDAGEAKREPLRKTVLNTHDHPALAVWEGPDEVVWNFTAYSGLVRNGTYETPDEWWRQTPRAIRFSEEQAEKNLRALRDGCRTVSALDAGNHPIWINEAAQSDMKFIRQYVEGIDCTGCDTYPIHDTNQKPWVVGDYTERFLRMGLGKPVWMVLQGFSWHELRPPKDRTLRYPSFTESRFMAYDALAHGAKGILYWGTQFVPRDAPFRESLLALTRELAALQPFLIAENQGGTRATCLDTNDRFEGPSRGIRAFARQANGACLVVLLNEDNHFHMGVEVEGLQAWNQKTLQLLYGEENTMVAQGRFVTRLAPLEVKVFALGRTWQTSQRSGRDFGVQSAQ